jgi:hypothetical protein
MQATKFIDQLQQLVEKHGDLEVVLDSDESADIEFSEAGGEQSDAFVIT